MAIPSVNQASLGPLLSPSSLAPNLNQSLTHVSVMNIPGIQQSPMPLTSSIPPSLNPSVQPQNALGNALGNMGMIPAQALMVPNMPQPSVQPVSVAAEDSAAKARKKMRLMSPEELDIVTRMWIEGISTESAARIMRVTIRTIQRVYKQLNEQCEKQRGPHMHENLPSIDGEIESEPAEEPPAKFEFQIPRRKRGRSKKDMSKVDSIIRDIEAQNSSLFGREIQDMLKEKHNIKMALTAVYDRLHAVRKQAGKEDSGQNTMSSMSSSSSSSTSSSQSVLSLSTPGTTSSLNAPTDIITLPGGVGQMPAGEYDLSALNNLGGGLSASIPMVNMGSMSQPLSVLSGGLNIGSGTLNMNGNPLQMTGQLQMPSHVKPHGGMAGQLSTGMGGNLPGVSGNNLTTNMSSMSNPIQMPNIVAGQLNLMDPANASNSNANNANITSAQLLGNTNMPVHLGMMGPHVHGIQIANTHSHMLMPHHMMIPNIGTQQHIKKE